MRNPPDWYRREIKRDFLLNDKENLRYDMIVKASYKTDGLVPIWVQGISMMNLRVYILIYIIQSIKLANLKKDME